MDKKFFFFFFILLLFLCKNTIENLDNFKCSLLENGGKCNNGLGRYYRCGKGNVCINDNDVINDNYTGISGISQSNIYSPCNSGCSIAEMNEKGCCNESECNKCCTDGITCDNGNCPVKDDSFEKIDNIKNIIKDIFSGTLKKKVNSQKKFITNYQKDGYDDVFYTKCMKYENSLYTPSTLTKFNEKCDDEVFDKLSDNFRGKLLDFDSTHCILPNQTKGVCKLVSNIDIFPFLG